ncbi:hypothetical protein GE061_018981 [Apolygus lucorum]|uniref:Uncharacterized protein n=1 Tax=Apolygus lucorum TaxID=248454 RepID=A0A8S9X8G4_APOLU|nr:hypothetical protein GE061_018981 [Apolygus lucorum]
MSCTWLPRIVALEVIRAGVFWADMWRELTARYGLTDNLSTLDASLLRTDIELILAGYRDEKNACLRGRVALRDPSSECETISRNPSTLGEMFNVQSGGAGNDIPLPVQVSGVGVVQMLCAWQVKFVAR